MQCAVRPLGRTARRYFDVEQRLVPVAEGRYVATPELVEPMIDENTIGLCMAMGGACALLRSLPQACGIHAAVILGRPACMAFALWLDSAALRAQA